MATILVIEDSEQFRQMLKVMLEQEGHQVTLAINGVEGTRLYREQKPQLVITDILMPEKDGIETILELRREFPDVVIVAMSGGWRSISPEFNLGAAAKIGVKATLAKPFTRQQLIQTVNKVMPLLS